MKVLITSGGSKVPIDRVRDITNMSHGTFGARIAHEALEMGHDVMFFHASYSCTPFKATFDCYDDESELICLRADVDGFDLPSGPVLGEEWVVVPKGAVELARFSEKHRDRYHQRRYRNFQDYAGPLQHLIAEYKPDMIILAAAISDYLVTNYVDGKIRSGSAHNIDLGDAPKVIGWVKGWRPEAFLVGFKFLVENDIPALIRDARKSIADNRCDMVVANTLQSLVNNDHTIRFVYPGHDAVDLYRKSDKIEDDYYLARKLIATATAGALNAAFLAKRGEQ